MYMCVCVCVCVLIYLFCFEQKGTLIVHLEINFSSYIPNIFLVLHAITSKLSLSQLGCCWHGGICAVSDRITIELKYVHAINCFSFKLTEIRKPTLASFIYTRRKQLCFNHLLFTTYDLSSVQGDFILDFFYYYYSCYCCCYIVVCDMYNS